MIKTALKLLVAAAILNAAARGAMSAWDYYQLRDESEQLIRFGATVSTSELHNQILAKATELGVPLAPENLSVRRDGQQTFVDARYTEPVELFPGYTRPIDWSFDVSALAVRPTTAEDLQQ